MTKTWLPQRAYPDTNTTSALFAASEKMPPPSNILVRAKDSKPRKVAIATGRDHRTGDNCPIEMPEKLLNKLCRCNSMTASPGTIEIEYREAGKVASRYYQPGVPGRFWAAVAAAAATVVTGLVSYLHNVSHHAPATTVASVHVNLWWATVAFGLVCASAIIGVITKLLPSH